MPRGAFSIDVSARTVRLASGRPLPFDRLIVATGSSPRHLEQVPGAVAEVFACTLPHRQAALAESSTK